MKCKKCDEPASVTVSVDLDGSEAELYLCRKCAEQSKLISTSNKPNLPMVVKKFTENVGFMTTGLAQLHCPDCGTKYMDFRKTGRLGCPYDYVVFRKGMHALLQRVHRAANHTGKRPRHLSSPVECEDPVRNWRYQLRQAIEIEDFQKASCLRDLIRAKELENGTR